MSQVTSAHGTAGGDRDGSGLPPVPSIPLADDLTVASGEQSIGHMVKDATAHLSTLVRAEVELAKSEVTREVKKVLIGSVFAIVALVLALYASIFLFFTIAEGISEGLPPWIAFAIVTVFLAALAIGCLILGVKKYKAIRAPQRTIDSVKETAAALRHRGSDERD